MTTISAMQLSFLCCLCVIIVVSEASFGPSYENSTYCNISNGNYTANSIYQTNLNTLLSTLTSHTEIDYGFYNFSHGQNSDKVYAIGLCRGDVKLEECRSCLNNSRVSLTRLCPKQLEAIKWEEKCMLRYSNRAIFHTMDASVLQHMNNVNNATDAEGFNKVLGELLRNLSEKAASGDSRRKYAADNAVFANLQTIYGLVQCTPDLSSQDCLQCLHWSFSDIGIFAKNKVGAVLLRPSCNVRFEIYPFYDEPTAPVSLPLKGTFHCTA